MSIRAERSYRIGLTVGDAIDIMPPMTEPDDLDQREEELRRDIDEFNREKERIKELIGKVGGTAYSKRDTVVNFSFLAIILVLFVLEVTTKVIPTFVSLEIGVLLVSVKIVWMIHSQNRYNHFVFWILNSMEYRMNDVAKQIRQLEKNLSVEAKD